MSIKDQEYSISNRQDVSGAKIQCNQGLGPTVSAIPSIYGDTFQFD